MSQSITLSRSFSNAESFLAAQRELYREYRRTHKLDAAAEAKYVANVKDAATCIDVTHNSFWVFGNTAPTEDSYVSFVVLRRIKNAIRRCIIAVKVNRAANVVACETEGICPVCNKLVSLEWHDHADEAGQLDETGE